MAVHILYQLFLDFMLLIGKQMREGKLINCSSLSGFQRRFVILNVIQLFEDKLTFLCRIIIGLTQFTNKAHIARATLEAVSFQTREVSSVFYSDFTT